MAATSSLSVASVSPVVIDVGSAACKVGFANWTEPRTTHKYQTTNDVKYPVERGQITDWENIVVLLREAFDILKTPAFAQPVMLTDSPANTKQSRETITSKMFETFSVPAFYLGMSNPLVSYALEKPESCISLECGDGITSVVCIFQGAVIPASVIHASIGGSDVTQSIADMNKMSIQNAEEFKKKLGFVTLNFESADRCAQVEEKKYELPDGKFVTAGKECYRGPECLFTPSLIKSDASNVAQLCYQSLMQCAPEKRKELINNVLISGGSSQLSGFSARLKSELEILVPGANPIVISPPKCQNAAWTGAALLASLDSFPKLCISKVEYFEIGPQIVHSKCSLTMLDEPLSTLIRPAKSQYVPRVTASPATMSKQVTSSPIADPSKPVSTKMDNSPKSVPVVMSAPSQVMPSAQMVLRRHNFERARFHKPTWCDQCGNFVKSPFGKQGYECTVCHMQIHSDHSCFNAACKGVCPYPR